MSPHGLGQSEETWWHKTPREVAARLDGLAIFVTGGKESEARQNADKIVAMAAAAGPVEQVKVTKIVQLGAPREVK